MRHSIKRISKSALSVILALMMVVSTMVVGIVSTNAASETGYAFNKQYLYVDASACSSATLTGVNYYWDDGFTNYGGWYTTYESLGNNIFKIDLSGTGNTSYLYFRGFKIVLSTGSFNIAVSSNSDYDCVTVDSNGTSGTWSTYSGGSGSTTYYYVAGTTALVNAENPWQVADQSDKMTSNDDGTYSITYTNLEPKDDNTYEFKITTGSWNTSFGYSDSITKQNVNVDSDNGNIRLKFSVKSDITITIDPKNSNHISIVATPVASDYTLSSSVVGSGEVTFTNASDSTTITTPAKLASGTSITVNATPSTGYQLDSIKLNDTAINNGDSFAMPSQNSTVVVTFSLKTPTVSLTPETASVNVGESVALTPSVTANGLDATGVYTITKGDSTLNVADYIVDSTFTTPKSADSAGTYVVTYTATVTSGSDSKSAFATSTITVAQSEEQQAYNTLVTWLADSSKNPANITGKTTSTLNAYITAYTTAQTAVSADYPTSGTANTTALSSLQSAYSALTDKTSLAKPELTALPQYIDLTSDSKTVSLSVSNASSYPAGANVTYSFYQEGNDTALYTGTNSSCTVDVATEGTFNYYVTINSYDTDNYTCASDTSESKSVIAVAPVTVSVTAGANGSAYVSSYTTYDNQTKSNTDTALTSVKVAPNSSVTFTAVPDEGYVVGVWNTDQSSGSTTYTVANITTATNVNVSFTDKPKFSYALVGASTIKDSSGQTAAWNDATTLDKAAFDADSSLKFTNNKLVVTASSGDQFRFIGTDGTYYYHYGSANKSNETIVYGTTYNTKLDDKLVYKFNEAGTFEIEITSGTDSPMSFKVTKLATYYIGGRFKVKASEGATDFTYTATTSENNSQWNDKSKKIPFTYAGDGIYKLDTYCTIKELSEQISNNSPYFLIHDGTTKFVSNVSKMHDMEDHNESRKVTLKKFSSDTTDDYLLFSDTSSTDTSLVTLYLDTTGTNLQIYYVAESGKTALDAPKISVDPSVLSTTATKATLTVTPADSYPEGVTYKLYRDGAYVIDFSGTTTTITSAGTYTVKAIPPADNADFKESPASNEAVVTDSRTPAVIYAKNGTVNGDSSTCKLGTTVAEAANSTSTVTVKDSSQPDYTTYDATSGSVVKVTTTMASGITDRYVHAFVVNGKKTYLATEGVADASGNKTYYAEFTLDSGAEKYEVTPIYYYNACKTEGEYIRFYVGASEMTGAFDWGNTISSYAYYYYYEGETRNQYESDGGWPGQPMMYDEAQQRYYALVPKEINGAKVSGLTVNNYGTDSVHAANFATTGNNVNKQTYDYDDFKIINESEYDIIRFDMKPRDVVENSSNKNKLTGVVESDNGSDADAGLLSKYKETPSSIFTDIADKESTRWEPFLDNNGNNVSILGKAVVDSNVKVYIVSTALYKLTDRGDYMTKWFVFKETTNTDNTTTVEYVTSGCPSDFIPRTVGEDQTEEGVNTAAYKAVLANGCDTALATIVYEDVKDSRIDGRWYYAQSDQPVSAYVKYRTSDDNGAHYTGLDANATYASVNGDVSVTNPKHGMAIQVVASPLTGYIFHHWSIFDNKWNWVADVEDLGQSFETTLDAEMYYVANFYKAAEGQLVISHSKYLGDDAKGGLGYYRLEVQVYRNGAWTDITSGTGTGANGQSVTIDVDSATDTYIRIKLITETAGENTFRYWYTRSSDGMEIIEDPDGDMTHNGSSVTEPTGLSGTLAYTFETEVWKLFRDNKQIINQMNFYSDIAPMTKNYKLTYIYDDRFGNQKSYVVTGTHDDSYYVKNENSWAPNEALIYEKAPYIDDLYKDCTWTMTKCTKDGTDATLTAVQKNKKYTVDIYDSTGKAYDTYQLAINSYVKNNAGQFYVADATYDNKEFSYWAVYERIVDAKGNVVKGKEVARHFYRKYTLVVLDNYIIKPVYGAVVEDKAYISDPQYSREQTTNADGSVVKDKLYVDFMLAYISSSPTDELISSDAQGTKYQTGILIEVDKTVKLKEGSSDYSDITFDSSRTDLEKIAKTTTTKNTYTYTNSDSTTSNRIVFNYRATNTNYNNMNRLEYFVYFNNTEANCSYVMKAYYYVIVDGKVILSDPVFFNLYEVGNSDPNTVTTTS